MWNTIIVGQGLGTGTSCPSLSSSTSILSCRSYFTKFSRIAYLLEETVLYHVEASASPSWNEKRKRRSTLPTIDFLIRFEGWQKWDPAFPSIGASKTADSLSQLCWNRWISWKHNEKILSNRYWTRRVVSLRWDTIWGIVSDNDFMYMCGWSNLPTSGVDTDQMILNGGHGRASN